MINTWGSPCCILACGVPYLRWWRIIAHLINYMSLRLVLPEFLEGRREDKNAERFLLAPRSFSLRPSWGTITLVGCESSFRVLMRKAR